EVYIRAHSEKVLSEIPLKNVEHTKGENYSKGKITLAKLIELKPLLVKEKVFIASLPFALNADATQVSAEQKAVHLKN
ncbi:MAG TPA: hypothetical protein VK806_08930, partial [Bacteroidia bacterium]|nr:hypothetical protein [Bacteroidia bacterium]